MCKSVGYLGIAAGVALSLVVVLSLSSKGEVIATLVGLASLYAIVAMHLFMKGK